MISVTANVAPRAMADMVAAAMRGDRAGATQIDQRLVALHRNLFVESNPIPVKWALARMGLMGGTLRLPLLELSPEYHAIVTESLFAAGISVEPRVELLMQQKVARTMRIAGIFLVASAERGRPVRLQEQDERAAASPTRTTPAPQELPPLQAPPGLDDAEHAQCPQGAAAEHAGAHSRQGRALPGRPAAVQPRRKPAEPQKPQ